MFSNFESKIQEFEINKSKILLIDNFLNKKFIKKIILENKKLNQNIKEYKKFNIKGKSLKKEFLNYNKFYINQKKLISNLSSKRIKNFLKLKFNLKENIYPDKTNGYSGINVVDKGGFLKPHIDFNYNSLLKKYRTINLLIYFNSRWKKEYGGNLIFYDYQKHKKKYEFVAKDNRAIIFLTNKYTLHGYNKISVSKKRFSLNFYYYTKKNFSYSLNPHKTLWMKN